MAAECHLLLWAVSLPLLLLLTACNTIAPTATPTPGEALPTPVLDPIAAERRELRFAAADGVILAGELSLPKEAAPAPLVVVIHHSGPVNRDAYGYLAELLVARGYAVFRFDKRGTGASGGSFGCCEAEDALAAYRAAVAEPGTDPTTVFLVAQSIGTRHVATMFADYLAAAPPRGVALLSSLLRPEEIVAIAAPVVIIVAATEPDLAQIGPQALAAHQAAYPGQADLYVAEGAEHTLFDITSGPIDWSDPQWVQRYHLGAMEHLLNWLDQQR